jgi:sugar-specific transcriptional regulator TrmB
MKKDTSVNIIDLDSILNLEPVIQPTEIITESVNATVTEQPVVNIDWDEIITEWFYRLPKGYADQPYNQNELSVLNDVLYEHGYLIHEAETAGSTDAEKILEILINIKPRIKSIQVMQKFLASDNIEAEFLSSYFTKVIRTGNPSEVYYSAITQIPANLKNARQLGTSNYPTTNKWRQYGGLPAVTSKTDVQTDKINFSVKNGSTQVRVLDASAPQLKALVMYSIEKLKYDQTITNEITKLITKLDKLYNSSSSTLSRYINNDKSKKYGLGDLRKVTDENVQKLIKDFDNNTQQLNKTVNAIFTKASADQKFTNTFILESLSGTMMFGIKSPGHADAILTFSSNFDKVKIHQMSDVTKKIASKYTMPKFGTKSSGNRISKTVQQFYSSKNEALVNELHVLYKQADKLLVTESKLLKNKLLMEEGLFQKAWQYLKQKGSDVLDAIKTVVNKILGNIQSFIESLIDAVKQGFTAALEFLDIDLDVQETVNEYASITYDDL